MSVTSAEDLVHGPCSETFIASFSCFMRSNEEVKGLDCVELFSKFQDCLKEHPEQVPLDNEVDG